MITAIVSCEAPLPAAHLQRLSLPARIAFEVSDCAQFETIKSLTSSLVGHCHQSILYGVQPIAEVVELAADALNDGISQIAFDLSSTDLEILPKVKDCLKELPRARKACILTIEQCLRVAASSDDLQAIAATFATIFAVGADATSIPSLKTIHQFCEVCVLVEGTGAVPPFIRSEFAVGGRFSANTAESETKQTKIPHITEILQACLRSDRPDGLFTTVVCDETDKALGLVYSSAESIAASVNELRGIYYSRSRSVNG